MQTETGPRYLDLVGDPPTAKDAATTALVTPEVVDALLAAIDAGTSPVEAAVPLAEAFWAAYDKYFRQKVGPLPWVRRTLPGRVTAITGKTCTVAVAGIAVPVTGVLYGVSKPRVGEVYPVRFPVALPPEGEPLAPGPMAYGAPWIKVPLTSTPWIYYGARIPSGGFGWYRAPLPAGGDPPPAYEDSAALLVAVQGVRGPNYLNWGGANLTGVAPTYSSRHLWMEDCGWPNNRDALYGAFGVTRPWRTLLRQYPEWGADPNQPASQDGDGLLTSYPWLHLTGTNLDPSADADYFLGAQYAVEPLTLPKDNPTFAKAKMANIRIRLASSPGGTSWGVRTPEILYGQKTKITYDSDNGYHAGFFNYVEGEMADAAGWTADVSSTWGVEGERIDYWAVQQLTPDPFPNELELIDIGTKADPNLIIKRYNESPSRIRVFVGRDGAAATEVALPGQPPGWVSAYPGFALRYLGGGRARAWWCGMPSQVQTRPGGAGHPVVITVTPIQLWRGELDLVNGSADWTLAGGPALNRLIAVNQDASVVLASVLTPSSGGGDTGSDRVYLTQNAGETWLALPALPYAVNWGQDRLVARLIDIP